MGGFGPLSRVGVEGTGCYGAGVARYLAAGDIEVAEVNRPDRSDRRRRGKSDTLDAVAAAQAARLGQRIAVPKTRDGAVEALRVLRLTRTGAVQARTKALQLLQQLIVAAPDPLRDRLRTLTRMRLIRSCAAWRPDPAGSGDPLTATRIALRSLARRILDLHTGPSPPSTRLIKPLVADLAPQLVARPGIGIQVRRPTADHLRRQPRIGSEAAFAMLCGVAPLPASSGKTRRHRLNRGGDRRANSALHTIAITRIRNDPRTQAYVEQEDRRGPLQAGDPALPETPHRPRGLLPAPTRHRPGRSGLTSHRGRLLHPQPSRRRAGAVNPGTEPTPDHPGLTAPSTGTPLLMEEPAALDTQGSIAASDLDAALRKYPAYSANNGRSVRICQGGGCTSVSGD